MESLGSVVCRVQAGSLNLGPGFLYEPCLPFLLVQTQLGRAVGHFIFSLIGLKRILFTSIFQKL